MAQAILGQLPDYVYKSGQILYKGIDIMQAEAKMLRSMYGQEIGFIPQNPSNSFNPVKKIKSHFLSCMSVMKKNSLKNKQIIVELLKLFGFEDVDRILAAYPFELSGGMQQRVLCAMGICCQPSWVLADEPTKGLDQELSEQVLTNLLKIKASGVNSMLIITHDLNLAKKICDVVMVMYAGQIVEQNNNIFVNPLHPYTQAFFASLPENGFQPMRGLPPSTVGYISGCKFANRCSYVQNRCYTESPKEYEVDGNKVRCFCYA